MTPRLPPARSGQAPAEFPFADVELARRLERAEAESNARFVDARARLAPASGACWIEVAGAYAMFDSRVSRRVRSGESSFPATNARSAALSAHDPVSM